MDNVEISDKLHANREQSVKDERNLVRAFRKVFGADDADRSPEQKRVWEVFQNRVEAPVFQAVRGGQLDPLHAATNEGQRVFARTCMALATTPIESKVEKPTVKK